MRTKIIAGNWKMNKDVRESAELVAALKMAITSPRATVVICPPFTALTTVQEILRGSPLRLGAQDVSVNDDGAFTGEISVRMLVSAGCEYVIVGHSERRQYFHESDELINRKAKKVLAAGLRAIICVGESLEQREKDITGQVVSGQIKGVLSGIPEADLTRVVIAYEPVWAIGTGRNATPAQAEEVHRLIRGLVEAGYSKDAAGSIAIQYGGSVKPENARELLGQPDIDGALVGGACLKADSFASIVQAAG